MDLVVQHEFGEGLRLPFIDNMSMQIHCPSCNQEFDIRPDLAGKMVECGVCDSRFKVPGELQVESYPKGGSRSDPVAFDEVPHKKNLGHYRKTPLNEDVPVNFQTMSYQPTSGQAFVGPISPVYSVTAALGFLIYLAIFVLLYLGTRQGGIFQDMPKFPERTGVVLFLCGVAGMLLWFGMLQRRFLAVIIAGSLTVILLIIGARLPVPKTLISSDGPLVIKKIAPRVLEDSEPKVKKAIVIKEEADVLEHLPYVHMQDAFGDNITSRHSGEEFVVGIWLREMDVVYEYLVRKYLQSTLSMESRPYSVNDKLNTGKLIIIEGRPLDIHEIAELCTRFGVVKMVWEDLRIIEIVADNEELGDSYKILDERALDATREDFYDLNLRELEHLDQDRIKAAVVRLEAAEPSSPHHEEICEKFVEIIEQGRDRKLVGEAGKALIKWDVGDKKRIARVKKVVDEYNEEEKIIPGSLARFLLKHKVEGATEIMIDLWVRNPAGMERPIIEIGSQMQELVAEKLKSENKVIRYSAASILQEIGTRKSRDSVKSAIRRASGDDERLLLERVLEKLN